MNDDDDDVDDDNMNDDDDLGDKDGMDDDDAMDDNIYKYSNFIGRGRVHSKWHLQTLFWGYLYIQSPVTGD